MRVGNSVNLPVVFAVEKDTKQFEITIKASTDGYVERLPVDLETDATLVPRIHRSDGFR